MLLVSSFVFSSHTIQYKNSTNGHQLPFTIKLSTITIMSDNSHCCPLVVTMGDNPANTTHNNYYLNLYLPLNQCWGNVGPASQTVAQRVPNTEAMYRVCWWWSCCLSSIPGILGRLIVIVDTGNMLFIITLISSKTTMRWMRYIRGRHKLTDLR